MGEKDNGLDLEKLYNVVVAPETWPDVLNDIARSANAVGACLATDVGSKTLIARPVSPELVAPIDDFLDSGWYKRDLRGYRAWPLLRQGRKVLIEHDVSTEQERRNSAYHNEWLRPWDLPWWGTLGFSRDGQHYGLVMLRNSRQDAFTYEDLRPLSGLRHHLARVLTLIETLSTQRAEAVLDTMDLIERPAFLLNAAGRVIRLNTDAKALLGSDFTLSHGVLRTTHAENSERLQALIATVLAPGISVTRTEPHWMVLRRLGRRPFIVKAMPIIAGLSDILTGARALLTVNDLESSKLPTPEKLREAFGLTPAEARTALLLAAGEDPVSAAQTLGITSGTVRDHLKMIFSKTHTRRQSELLQLIERMRGS